MKRCNARTVKPTMLIPDLSYGYTNEETEGEKKDTLVVAAMMEILQQQN